jgi:hypothetical protein
MVVALAIDVKPWALLLTLELDESTHAICVLGVGWGEHLFVRGTVSFLIQTVLAMISR